MNDSRTPRSTASLANARSVLTNSACAGGKSFSCVQAGKVRTNSKSMAPPDSFIGYLLAVFLGWRLIVAVVRPFKILSITIAQHLCQFFTLDRYSIMYSSSAIDVRIQKRNHNKL